MARARGGPGGGALRARRARPFVEGGVPQRAWKSRRCAWEWPRSPPWEAALAGGPRTHARQAGGAARAAHTQRPGGAACAQQVGRRRGAAHSRQAVHRGRGAVRAAGGRPSPSSSSISCLTAPMPPAAQQLSPMPCQRTTGRALPAGPGARRCEGGQGVGANRARVRSAVRRLVCVCMVVTWRAAQDGAAWRLGQSGWCVWLTHGLLPWYRRKLHAWATSV